MSDGYERTGDQAGDEGADAGEVERGLPDIPDAGDASVPITSPNPIDFSTTGIAAAGSAGMSTFNDDDDRSLFERTADVFEEADVESPMLGDAPTPPVGSRRARIYGS